MTIKNILFALIATAVFSAYSTYTLDASEESRYVIRPQDPEKTPTTPDIIEHQPSMLKAIIFNKRIRVFKRKRIYFGTEFGQPCYATIWQHAANNPDFGNVKLVIFQGNSKLAKFFNKFSVIGTYADKNKRQQLIDRIAKHGGVWCPEQNAIIAGTRDKNIGKAFAKFEKENANRPKSKISKK